MVDPNLEELVINAYREKGILAVPYRLTMHSGESYCCALGAISADGPYDARYRSFRDVGPLIGMTAVETDLFTMGFDLALDPFRAPNRYELELEHFVLGHRIGERVIAEGLCAPGYPKKKTSV